MRGRQGRMKLYCQSCQRFPLHLPPVKEQDQLTCLFGKLQNTCEENATQLRMKYDWISEESWRLIAHRAMLRRTGCLCQAGGHRMDRRIGVSIQKDWTDQTAKVGAAVEAELAGGNVQEAFRHL